LKKLLIRGLVNKMAAIDKLYCPKSGKVLLRLDYYDKEELLKLIEQINDHIEKYNRHLDNLNQDLDDRRRSERIRKTCDADYTTTIWDDY
jgi:hypothetical protein